MDSQKLKQYYQDIMDKESIKLSSLKSHIFRVGSLRLVVVLVSVAALYIFWHNSGVVRFIIIFALIVSFASLLKYHNRLLKRKVYSEICIVDAQNELKGLEYNFENFDGASEKIDQEHSFSLDLDLFGERSFFQSINRTVTSFGKNMLANTLIEPLCNSEEIRLQQEAVKELANKIKMASHFRTLGQVSGVENLNLKDFAQLASKPAFFFGNKFWFLMIYLVPSLYAILGILSLLGVISSSIFIPFWFLTLAISSLRMKKTVAMGDLFDKKTAVLETYFELFQIVEREQFSSSMLKTQQNLLLNSKASQSIGVLKTYNNNLQQSVTFPVLFIFNPLLLWNIRYAYQIEKWMKTHKDDINEWFAAIGKFDSLVSLAIFAYNHPDYIYPTPTNHFIFEGEELGHPLIHREVCVRNSVSIPNKAYFLVVTGANMAGKSTYLRTIGLNHTLACAGMPVCAQSLTFYPGKLVTNLRTADSLADNESYFFAELKRLKMIIDRLESGEELFIILDEILKGTNSEDKQKGSLALMKQLITLKANGIIATHDLLLGRLEGEYPDHVKNYCFEADIKDDQLSFTYCIREGIAQNMNACFLMKKMGITGL